MDACSCHRAASHSDTALPAPDPPRADAALLVDLFTRATPDEQRFLVRLLTGELRQGALEGIMLEAVASAAGVPADTAPADSLDAALAELGEVSVEYKLDGARIRYRSDKNARDADIIDAVRALLTISR